MKKHIKLLTAVLAGIVFATVTVARTFRKDESAEDNDKVYQAVTNPNMSLPHMAWVSDIVGVGRLTNICENTESPWSGGFADIVIDDFWRGDPGSNTFKLSILFTNQSLVSSLPRVFFLKKYHYYRDESRNTSPTNFGKDAYWDMDSFRANSEAEGVWFFHGTRPWITVSEESTDLIAFASNLVFAVNSHNEEAFFQHMRDVYETAPFASRLYMDSSSGLLNLQRYCTLDFLQNKWKNRRKLLSSDMEEFINAALYRGYKIDLPFDPETITIVK